MFDRGALPQRTVELVRDIDCSADAHRHNYVTVHAAMPAGVWLCMKFAVILMASRLFAQSPGFEVAWFKRQRNATRHGLVREISSTDVTFRNTSLGILITWAYRFEYYDAGPLTDRLGLAVYRKPRHTIDETGLTGAFDFALDLTEYAQGDAAGRLDMESAYLPALPRKNPRPINLGLCWFST